MRQPDTWEPYDPLYPDSDGEPMAENTTQYEWIVTLKGGFDTVLPDFVAGDLFWYAVEGQPGVRLAPDVLVAVGRPKGHRRSYKQWVEGQPPTLVIEVISPSNTLAELHRKLTFYDTHGADEFVVYHPFKGELTVWERRDGRLQLVDRPDGWTSPSTGVTFGLDGLDLVATSRDGHRFRSFAELAAEAASGREAQALAAEARALAAEATARADALEAELAALRARLDGGR